MTEQTFKMALATIIIVGYGIILIAYMWLAPAENETLKAVIAGLTSGYLLVLQGVFRGGS